MLDGSDNVIPFPGSADLGESLLDQLLIDSQEAPAAAPLAAKQPIQKLNYSHEAMIDLIIADPGISQNRLAQHFGYSASWVSTVMASDAFQAKLAERTKDLVDPSLRASIDTRFKALVLRSLEILAEKLNGPVKDIPPQLALRTLDVASRCAGYGAREPVAPPVQQHNHLHLLAGNLTDLLRQKKAEAAIPLELVQETSHG